MSSTSVRTVLGQTYVSFCYYTSNEDKITRWIHSFVNEWSKKKKIWKGNEIFDTVLFPSHVKSMICTIIMFFIILRISCMKDQSNIV